MQKYDMGGGEETSFDSFVNVGIQGLIFLITQSFLIKASFDDFTIFRSQTLTELHFVSNQLLIGSMTLPLLGRREQTLGNSSRLELSKSTTGGRPTVGTWILRARPMFLRRCSSFLAILSFFASFAFANRSSFGSAPNGTSLTQFFSFSAAFFL
jgi:hypothetical protein